MNRKISCLDPERAAGQSPLFWTTEQSLSKDLPVAAGQEVYQVLFLNDGDVGMELGRELIVFPEPCLLVLPPLFSCRWVSLASSCVRLPVLLFDHWLLHPVFEEKETFALVRRFLSRAVKGLMLTGKNLRECCGYFVRLLKLEACPGEQDVLFLSLLILLSQSSLSGFVPDTCRLEGGSVLMDERLEKVCAYIRDNYRRHISEAEIAGLACLSISALHALFRKYLNCCFTEYLNEVRIKQACRMLRQTNEKITAIAYDCGFQTFSYFSERFKRLVGMSPTEYRRITEN